jgi:two-component system CheB/CheR fusion protein
MEAPLQKKLIELFNYSLLPGGIMILGSAEAIIIMKDLRS